MEYDTKLKKLKKNDRISYVTVINAYVVLTNNNTLALKLERAQRISLLFSNDLQYRTNLIYYNRITQNKARNNIIIRPERADVSHKFAITWRFFLFFFFFWRWFVYYIMYVLHAPWNDSCMSLAFHLSSREINKFLQSTTTKSHVLIVCNYIHWKRITVKHAFLTIRLNFINQSKKTNV